MEFEWDEVKDEKNRRERGIPFMEGARIFEARVHEVLDDRRDYGESRVRATGISGEVLLTVVYTQRAEVRRIISVRLANRKERLLWQSSE